MLLVNDFDFNNAEHKELPVIKISSDEGRLRSLSTILKPEGTQASLELLIAVTILLILSILFNRVTVNVFARCIFHVYIDCGAVRYGNVPGVGILHYQQVLS